MSNYLIEQYHKEVEKIIRYGGSRKETSIRNAFHKLLNQYCQTKDFLLIPELDYKLPNGKTVYPDGTVKDALRLEWGFWESKDTFDDLDKEIQKKIDKGYPTENILFEDSEEVVLIQADEVVMRKPMEDAEALDDVLTQFIEYQRPEVRSFREAIEQFKEDLPNVLEALREMIEKQAETNEEFQQARTDFLQLCKESIHEDVTFDDVREMMIQHILTDEIFSSVFDESHFHRENNIAQQLQEVVNTFFTGDVRRRTMVNIEDYYKVIKAEAASISNYHEKQKFLKVIYENFYHIYNPKAADRLGVFYTPNEIVDFMIRSTDYLLHKHFGRMLSDKNVEILDPAAGTGTFMTDLIEYMPPDKLEYKYENEMHANEVAILPYYIANLNIEFTYKQRMDDYKEFENIVFVDTLDNLGFKRVGKQDDLFGFSAENTERIQRQNERKISVVMGNPPYSAKQENYNYQNANRAYQRVDQRIKDTYIKEGTAQNQITVYDMYTRFFRWATDRLDENGVVAFVSNNSFLNARAFDGFRKVVGDEFNYLYAINLKGDARTSGERRQKEGGNVFNDQIRVGVAVYFFIRKEEAEGFKIFYNEIDDYEKAEAKQKYLSENTIKSLDFEHIRPSKRNNWLKLADNNFEDLIPLIDKDVKKGKSEQAIFKLFSRGVASQRDDWVYDVNEEHLKAKMKYFVDIYQQTLEANGEFDDKYMIKWDADLERYLERGIEKSFDASNIVRSQYRPFHKRWHYYDYHFNGRTYQWPEIFRENKGNTFIAINSPGNSKDFYTIASETIVDLHFTGDSQCIPLHWFDDDDNEIENITEWGLEQFQEHFWDDNISKKDIFHYVYAVLNNPAYREKYKLNLKRDFPRIPFHDDFDQWVQWGKQLMELHLNYEEVEPYDLELIETDFDLDRAPKTKLKADHENGILQLDEKSTLHGIPDDAWRYELGNRTALEWICYYRKERKSRDDTIQEHFNDYDFQDYKEEVIDLLKRVCTVSVKTVKIQDQMRAVTMD
jgi:predicted helicase